MSGEQIKPGYKRTEVGVIPSDWDAKKLSEISERIMVGIASAATHAYRENGIPLLRNQNIKPGYLDVSDILHVAPSYELAFQNKRLRSGDLLTTRTGYPGITCVVTDKYHNAQSFTTLITRPKSILTDSSYLCYYINSEQGQRFFEQAQIGGAQKNVNAGILQNMPVPMPRLDEQRAIATALSDVDVLLAKLDQLIAKKRDLKQTAMQQLLTGQTRLPGFSGEWEVKRLGDVVEIRKGQLITEKNAVNGPIPVIAGGKKPSYYHNQSNRTGKTITVSASGASAGFVALYDYPIFASDCSTISESKSYDINFVYFQLLLRQDEIYKSQTGGAQPHIHPADLQPLEIPFCSSGEQTAIAAVLSNMDAEIAILESRRDKTRALKQGMMQELLTGRIRLV